MSLKLENEAFSSIVSGIKPVKTGSRLFTEFHSNFAGLVQCINILHTYVSNNIYICHV